MAIPLPEPPFFSKNLLKHHLTQIFSENSNQMKSTLTSQQSQSAFWLCTSTMISRYFLKLGVYVSLFCRSIVISQEVLLLVVKLPSQET